MTDHAAALTYFSLLSLFPALLASVAVLGFFGQEGLIDRAAEYLKDAGAPQTTIDAVTSALDSALGNRGTALTALLIGLATSLYGASGRLRSGRAGAQRRLPGRGGARVHPPEGDQPPDDDRGHPPGPGHLRADLPRRRPGQRHLRRDRARRLRGAGVEDRPLAARARDRDARSTRSSTSPRPNVEVPHFRWITPGAVAGVLVLAPRLGRLLLLRLELLVLRRHLRGLRRRRDPARLAVADEHRAAARRRAQRGDRPAARARAAAVLRRPAAPEPRCRARPSGAGSSGDGRRWGCRGRGEGVEHQGGVGDRRRP